MEDTIKKIIGRQIFDSRGTPTVEATVILNSGVAASAAAPSGASTGQFEAHEKRDGGDDYHGMGVLYAVDNINTTISTALEGESIFDQYEIDQTMISLDHSDNKSNLGANATLAVSLAAARAAAYSADIPLFEYIGGINAVTLPIPLMNILNGGAHASNNVDIQEFMIMPIGAESFEDAMRMGTDVYKNLKKILSSKGLSTAVGDEGGFAPNLNSDEQALDFIVDAIEKSGYIPGYDLAIALDIASSEWVNDDGYYLPKRNTLYTKKELIEYIINLKNNYPIVSVEYPLGETDFEGFTEITQNSNIQIVGDDLFVTNIDRLRYGVNNKSANAILIKPNQIGTLSETLDTIRFAQKNNYKTIISHRSGETADTFIADLAVAVNSGQIKAGAPARSERIAKYNRLLQIELSLGNRAVYPPNRNIN